MTFKVVGLGDHGEQASQETAYLLRSGHVGLKDGELVAAKAGNGIDLAQLRAQAVGNALQQHVTKRVAQRVVHPFEVVEVDAQHREAASAPAQVGHHVFHAEPQQDAVRQGRERIVVGHECHPRLGLLALGDVDRSNHRCLAALVGQLPLEDGNVDHVAIGLAVPPCPARLLVPIAVGGTLQAGLVRRIVNVAQPHAEELRAVIAVVLHRRVVDGEKLQIVERIDEHRHRVAVEQQPERGLALLHLGDVDAQADDAAVAGAAFFDQDGAAVGQGLFVSAIRIEQLVEALLDPFFAAAFRLRVIAALDADAQRFGELGAGLEQVGAALVDLGVLLVPEDVPAVGIEEHDAFRQDVDGVAQPRVCAACIEHGRRGFCFRPRCIGFVGEASPQEWGAARGKVRHPSLLHSGDVVVTTGHVTPPKTVPGSLVTSVHLKSCEVRSCSLDARFEDC